MRATVVTTAYSLLIVVKDFEPCASLWCVLRVAGMIGYLSPVPTVPLGGHMSEL